MAVVKNERRAITLVCKIPKEVLPPSDFTKRSHGHPNTESAYSKVMVLKMLHLSFDIMLIKFADTEISKVKHNLVFV